MDCVGGCVYTTGCGGKGLDPPTVTPVGGGGVGRGLDCGGRASWWPGGV